MKREKKRFMKMNQGESEAQEETAAERKTMMVLRTNVLLPMTKIGNRRRRSNMRNSNIGV